MTTIRAIACLAILALAGCLVLPLPIPPTGTAVDSEVTAFDIGSTTREQVRRTFGEPNILASDQFDIWQLEHDPAHLWVFVGFGGPGDATGAELRTGATLDYYVVVAYDAEGKVTSWRWARSSDVQTASSDSGVGGPPFEPVRVVQWKVDWVLRSSDGELFLVEISNDRRMKLAAVSEIDGTIFRSMNGDGPDCGVLVPFNFADREVSIGWSEGKLVSVPPALKPDAMPCEWGTSPGGDFGGVPLGKFTASERPLPARLVGEFIVLRDPAGTVNIFDLRGRLLAPIEGEWTISHAATNVGSTRLLLRLIPPQGRMSFWLFDRDKAELFEVEKMSRATRSEACYPGFLALSPDGELAALRCTWGVELWSVPVAHEDAERLEILPLPFGLKPSQIAFSPDGRRLVAAQPGIVVWRTSDWQIEAFRGDSVSSVLRNCEFQRPSSPITKTAVATGDGSFWGTIASQRAR